MTAVERLGADELRAVMIGYRDVLRAHRERLNRLNVYPVPDGDTGTNMALTLDSVVDGLDGASGMGGVCSAIRQGSLMGARGNSGVILSQVLRGLADRLGDEADCDASALAEALGLAGEAAYRAVLQPVEGTILTVVREAAAAAQRAASGGASMVAMLEEARAEAGRSLERTPELLPVLARAGVVDAGGAGFVLLLDALLSVVASRPLPEAPAVPASGVSTDPGKAEGSPATDEGAATDVAGPRYEVMYFLEAPDDALPAFKESWAAIGDSIVVVGGEGTWNCHIHTDDIGAALEAGLQAGRPRQVRVTDLTEQVEQLEEERREREAGAPSSGSGSPAAAGPTVTTAVVVVANGAGLEAIFRSLGVQCVVAGGQSMNPSTASVVEAVEAAPGGQVVVLPNNGNIVPVARQAAELSTKPVRVVPSTTIPEGFAALLEYDPAASADENASAMQPAVERTVSGEVTRAVRRAETPAGLVAEGDYLGLVDGEVVAVGSSLVDVTCSLFDLMIADGHEVAALVEGDGASGADTAKVAEWLADRHPGLQVEVHHGGQPLYPYLIGIE